MKNLHIGLNEIFSLLKEGGFISKNIRPNAKFKLTYVQYRALYLLYKTSKENILSIVEKYDRNIVYTNKTQACTVDNIEFQDGYYLIYIINKDGEKMKEIRPLRIADTRSLSVYNRWTHYFKEKLSTDIVIVYNKQKVVDIKGYNLSDFINLLSSPQNVLSTDEFLKYLSDSKISFEQCLRNSKNKNRNIIKYNNNYLDFLSKRQNDRNIIKVYETFDIYEENCFIFSINFGNDKEIILLENTNPSRATEVFIICRKDYDLALKAIFEYFTNYELNKKRENFRKHVLPPELFHSLSYTSIDHDKQRWFIVINDIIYNNDIQLKDKTAK